MEDALRTCIKTLEEQVKPTTNDIRFRKYVEYINAFLQHFGDERVYLVGSTGDGTKLTVPTDHGDADYLFVTGQMEVPVHLIKFKPESTSYCWIRSNGIALEIGQGFIDNGYLKSGILHELHPILFSVARGIYIHLSSNIDRVREANKDKTSLGIRSKVGLAHTTYRGIEILGNLDRYRHNVTKASTQGGPVTLPTLDEEDSNIFGRFFELLKIAKRPGTRDEFRGEITFFVDLLEEALSTEPASTELAFGFNKSEDTRPKALVDGVNTIKNACMVGDAERKTPDICASHMKTLNEKQQDLGACAALKKPLHDASDYHQHDRDETENGEEGIILQFKKTTNKDFVPAIKIVGKLECMDRWEKRVTEQGWAEDKIDDILRTDVYLITREAIVSPNPSLDFCLAFSLQEQKLVKGFSKGQRIVYLILKTLRKGCFDHTFKENNIAPKLRTYHMKTVALWIFENGYHANALDISEHERIIQATMDAVTYLKTAVNSKVLRHYFTEDNLFANFDKSDCKIISEVCDAIQGSTTDTLAQSLKRNEITTDKIRLSMDEIGILLKLQDDGGRQNNVDRVREALADILRGINSAKTDCQDNESALKLALLDVSRLALQNHSSNMSATKEKDTTQGNTLGLGKTFKAVIRKLTDHSQDNINLAELLLNVNPKLKQEVERIGGIELVLSNVDTDHGAGDIDGLLKLIEDFLTVPNELKDKIATELKVKFALIFS